MAVGGVVLGVDEGLLAAREEDVVVLVAVRAATMAAPHVQVEALHTPSTMVPPQVVGTAGGRWHETLVQVGGWVALCPRHVHDRPTFQVPEKAMSAFPSMWRAPLMMTVPAELTVPAWQSGQDAALVACRLWLLASTEVGPPLA